MDMAPVLSLAVALDEAQNGHLHLYAGTENNGLFSSTDSGLSWQPVSMQPIAAGAPMGAVHAIQVTAQPTARLTLLLEDELLQASVQSRDSEQKWNHYQLPSGKLAMAMLSNPETDTILVGFADGALLPMQLS